METVSNQAAPNTPWNKGKLVGQKAPLKLKEIWAIRVRLQLEPPFAATLANQIPSLPPTLGLQVAMRLTGPTTRPEFHLAAVEHPIYREQTAGITVHRIHEYNAFFA